MTNNPMPERHHGGPDGPEQTPLDRMHVALNPEYFKQEDEREAREKLEKLGLEAAKIAQAEVLTRYVERNPQTPLAEEIVRTLDDRYRHTQENYFRADTTHFYNNVRNELGEEEFAELLAAGATTELAASAPEETIEADGEAEGAPPPTERLKKVQDGWDAARTKREQARHMNYETTHVPRDRAADRIATMATEAARSDMRLRYVEEHPDTLLARVYAAALDNKSVRSAFHKGPPENVDLTDADLRGTTLTGADLTNVDLRGVDLRAADLTNADLRGADLVGVRFAEAKLTGAHLEKLDLTVRDFTNVDLRGAYLRGTDFFGTVFRGADLTGTDLTNAGLKGADFRGARGLTADQRADLEARGALVDE